jgi:hypothetical protein
LHFSSSSSSSSCLSFASFASVHLLRPCSRLPPDKYTYRERKGIRQHFCAIVLQRRSAVLTLCSSKPAAKRTKKARETRIEFKNHHPPTHTKRSSKNNNNNDDDDNATKKKKKKNENNK